MENNCKNCGKPILVAIFKGEDWCSDNCRKVLSRESSDRLRECFEETRRGWTDGTIAFDNRFPTIEKFVEEFGIDALDPDETAEGIDIDRNEFRFLREAFPGEPGYVAPKRACGLCRKYDHDVDACPMNPNNWDLKIN